MAEYRYKTMDVAYPGPFREISKKDATIAFHATMLEKSWRVNYFLKFLSDNSNLHLSLQSSFLELDPLPEIITSLGGRRPSTAADEQVAFENVPKQFREYMRETLPRWESTTESLLMAFDAGLFWGDLFIGKYPVAKWAIGGGGKLSFDYQWPVIIGEANRKMEFNPVREMHEFIQNMANGRISKWTLSSISTARARGLHLVAN